MLKNLDRPVQPEKKEENNVDAIQLFLKTGNIVPAKSYNPLWIMTGNKAITQTSTTI
jgi:hypothetical protein